MHDRYGPVISPGEVGDFNHVNRSKRLSGAANAAACSWAPVAISARGSSGPVACPRAPGS